MMEILQAMRTSRRHREVDESAADDMLEAEDLETTPLSTAQLKVLYPKAMNNLDEIHYAIFGTFEPDETGSGLRFVADQQCDAYHFSDAGEQMTGTVPVGFARAFEDWLCTIIAKARGRQGQLPQID